jgi:predicted nucleic acid-binding protein
VIVVDSSVWISWFRGKHSRGVHALQSISDTDRILLGDIVLLELLQGARGDANAARIERVMREFTIVGMVTTPLVVAAAANYRRLRSRGITIRATTDVIIATYCIENDHELLHEDRDFAPFASHLGLKTIL